MTGLPGMTVWRSRQAPHVARVMPWSFSAVRPHVFFLKFESMQYMIPEAALHFPKRPKPETRCKSGHGRG